MPTGFDDLIDEAGYGVGIICADKAAALAWLAGRAAARTGLDAGMIIERVLQREALGPTGFGGGAAIPHARIDGLAAIVVEIAVLARAIEFGAIDDQPVDIVVLMLSPEAAGADHLKALARISRTLRDPARLAAIRAAGDGAALQAALRTDEAPRKAA
jgi:PTS system nitrogen regulatory IIA component